MKMNSLRCFLALLLIAAILWKIKQKYDRYKILNFPDLNTNNILLIPDTGGARDSTSRWSRWRAGPSARSWSSWSGCRTPRKSPATTQGQESCYKYF